MPSLGTPALHRRAAVPPSAPRWAASLSGHTAAPPLNVPLRPARQPGKGRGGNEDATQWRSSKKPKANTTAACCSWQCGASLLHGTRFDGRPVHLVDDRMRRARMSEERTTERTAVLGMAAARGTAAAVGRVMPCQAEGEQSVALLKKLDHVRYAAPAECIFSRPQRALPQKRQRPEPSRDVRSLLSGMHRSWELAQSDLLGDDADDELVAKAYDVMARRSLNGDSTVAVRQHQMHARVCRMWFVCAWRVCACVRICVGVGDGPGVRIRVATRRATRRPRGGGVAP